MTSEPKQTALVSVDRPTDWWKSAVVYQIYPPSFADSNGDGFGDIQGIASRLDYLVELGVDVVWLSPVYASPMDDNGYDISDYLDVDPIFGTLEDLDRLIAGLHERGIKIVMDLVVNHTSDEHAWFIESRDPGSAKREWYWWRPARTGFEPGSEGAEPTNWESAFRGSAWQFDERSGEYYLHVFSPKQPDLNWENPEVRRAVYDMMNWWVDRGVDGFRMDVINLISKHELGDGVPAPGRTRVSSFFFTANGPRLDEFLAEMNVEVGLDARNLLTVGEMPGSTVEMARRATDPANHELNMVFTFEHVSLDSLPDGGGKFDLAPLSLPPLKKNLNEWQLALADVGWNSLYWDNHDQPRAVSRFGDDSPEHRENSAKTLATVQHMHKGTPYIYQGEELGMTNTYFTAIEQYRDIESINFHADALSLGMEVETVLHALSVKSRDNARTPMQWDDSSQAGFTEGIPWLPVNPNYLTINAAAAIENPSSVFHHFRKLIKLRHDHPVIVHGRFELLLPDHEQIWAITRMLDDQVLLTIANWSSEPASVPPEAIPDLTGAQVLLATHGDSTSLELEPWESRIYLLD
ncbi:MAG TPA: alpha-glucosidase [Propionibacteriaceae bacterium]|nr:alpha-glucosidase [Propionibacteriaceae bacterium]